MLRELFVSLYVSHFTNIMKEIWIYIGSLPAWHTKYVLYSTATISGKGQILFQLSLLTLFQAERLHCCNCIQLRPISPKQQFTKNMRAFGAAMYSLFYAKLVEIDFVHSS